MRIEPRQSQPVQAAPPREASSSQTARESTAKRPDDAVKLSDDSRAAQRAQADAAAAPDVRSERVASIKAQIDAGTYEIDNEQLAEKLLNVL